MRPESPRCCRLSGNRLFREGYGADVLSDSEAQRGWKKISANVLKMDGMEFKEPHATNVFPSTTPSGACTHCGGLRQGGGIDEDKGIP